MSWKRQAVFVIAVLAIAGLGYTAWRYVEQRESLVCKACSRPVHAQSRTVALIDGKRGVYCCPACALSEHQQAQKPVEVIELADHLGGQPLRPGEAFIVRNSDVQPCLQHQATVTEDRQPLHAAFDRCSPSMLAFKDLNSAQAFAEQHGGEVLRFADLASQYRR